MLMDLESKVGCFEKAEARGSNPPLLKINIILRKTYTTFYYYKPTNFKLQITIKKRVDE
jgi:hypothetical protein